MTPFGYHKPVDVAAAKAVLAANADAALLAGGMTLLPTLKNRLREVSDLVDLGAVPGLSDIRAEQGHLRIGAMANHAAVAASDVVRAHCPALSNLAAGIGDPQVRNRGTIGGSIANNDPAADWPAALLACNAQIMTSTAIFSADDFFTGMFETALPGGDIITSVSFPKIETAAYAKYRHSASGYAVAGVFVARVASAVRVAVTGAVAGVERWLEAESVLSNDFSAKAAANLVFASDSLMSDIHASSEYRAHLVAVMLRRALASLNEERD
jgi:aerobic carbon-monoxide dehydrogenase medium subunit